MIFDDHTYLSKHKVDREETEPNTKYIGLEHIGEGTLSLNGFGYASDVSSSKTVFEKGDILFGKLRPYFRKVIIAPFNGICSTDIWVVKPKNGIDRNFLFYWMASQEFVDEVTRSSEGTRMPRAKWEVAKQIEIPDVSVLKQQKIGKVLYTHDQKIHHNQQTNETLEAMAQVIDRKSTRLNSSHVAISYAVFCLKNKPPVFLWCDDDTPTQHTFPTRRSSDLEGTRMPRAKWEVAKQIEIPDVSVLKQQKIGKVLYTLDQKIHLNQQTNETLEAMAQAIFKSWFVDFDPVRAKMRAKAEGRDGNRAAMAAIAGVSLERDWDEIEKDLNQKLTCMSKTQCQQLHQIAALFPAELVVSELGEVPKGWGYSTIGKEFIVVNGQSPPGSSYNETGEGEPFYQGRTDFGFRFPTQIIYCTEPKRFAKKGDTLLSVRAPVGDLNIAIEDCCIGRGLSALRHKSGSGSFTYYAMKKIQNQIEAYEATGTVFGSINQKQLKSLETIAPNDDVIEEFNRIAEPMDAQIMNLEFMNRELSNLRDTLRSEERRVGKVRRTR